MESPDVAAREYRSTLAELRTNNKTQINLLTILAEDYKEAAAQIVDVIGEHLHTVSPSQKLPVMYVCDSILKNTKKPHDYDKLFSRKIVSMFEHVFKQGDEKVRSALYKLRVTWASTSLFMPSKLYQLDMKINAMDSAWPISNPDTGRALRNDPNVAPPTPTPSSSANSLSGSASSRGVHVNRKFIEPNGGKRTTADKTRTPPSKSEAAAQKSIKKEIKKETVDPLFSDKLLPSAGASAKNSSSNSKRKAVPAEHSNAPNRKKQPVVQDEDLRSTSRQSHQDQDFRQRPLKPTSVVGSHAFSAPARPIAPPPPPAPGANNFLPQPLPFLPQPTAPQHHSSPPQDPAPLMSMPVQQPPPTQSNPLKHVYSSEQTKLDVPANNRIFVDGKAYEVMFIDDTAVIERAGAPHRIYFAGVPRNLVVDGTPHLIPFDTPTEIEICGAKHVVKYGAPSRELYIGGHPFKGQFGGPPIVATINGRRHEIRLTGSAPEVRIEPEPAYHLTRFLHKMREEKKIEIIAEKPKEPLEWMVYLKGLRASGVLPPTKSQTPPPQPQPAASGNQNQHGRGGRHNQNNRPTPPSSMQPGMWNQKPTMMPESIPSASGVEKRHFPPAAIADFNIRLLQIRYDSVVDRLVTKRLDACKFCGMRLDDSQGRSKEWQDHMDWHVKQNLAQHGNTANYRKWYPTAVNWLTARASDQPNQDQENARDEPLPGVASTGVMSKECAVCQEKFDEYFDDDEEMWRLRDTVNVHGKIVHAACSADVSLIVVETPTSSEQQPFFVDAVKYENADEEDVKPDVKNLITAFEQQNPLSTH